MNQFDPAPPAPDLNSIKIKSGDLQINYSSLRQAPFSKKKKEKNSAAVALGKRKTTFYRYVNLSNYSIYSPTLDMEVFIEDSSLPLSDSSPNFSVLLRRYAAESTGEYQQISGAGLKI